MKIRYIHDKTTEQSYDIINNFFKPYPQDKAFIIDLSSNEFSFKANGFDIKGNISLYNHEIILKGRIPLRAKFSHRKIKQEIRRKLEGIL